MYSLRLVETHVIIVSLCLWSTAHVIKLPTYQKRNHFVSVIIHRRNSGSSKSSRKNGRQWLRLACVPTCRTWVQFPALDANTEPERKGWWIQWLGSYNHFGVHVSSFRLLSPAAVNPWRVNQHTATPSLSLFSASYSTLKTFFFCKVHEEKMEWKVNFGTKSELHLYQTSKTSWKMHVIWKLCMHRFQIFVPFII